VNPVNDVMTALDERRTGMHKLLGGVGRQSTAAAREFWARLNDRRDGLSVPDRLFAFYQAVKFNTMRQAGVDLRTWVAIGLGHPPNPRPATWRQMLVDSPNERREAWEGRAAIVESEGGLPRCEAEPEAFARLQAKV